MIDGLFGSDSDKHLARVASDIKSTFEKVDALAWRDVFWEKATAVLAEETTEGLQQKLAELAESITAWDQAITQRQARGNEAVT